MSTRIDGPESGGHHNDMMPMMAAMMAVCLGVLTLAVLLPALGLPVAVALAIALGAVMVIAHRLFMHPGGHRR